jgi:glycyl-tRNA synthetase beta chain
MPELLFEIGTEELPAGFIDPALAFLQRAVAEGLTAARLAHGNVMAEGTPRRLVVIVDDVAARQADKEDEITGPAWSVAFTRGAEGNLVPTPAGEGFLRKNNLKLEDVYEKDSKKGPVVAARVREAGRPAADIVGPLLEGILPKVPFKKTMSWGDGRATHRQVFGRPVQWLLALLGGRPLDVRFADVESGETTRGHRYHAPDEVKVSSVSEYRRALERGEVVLSRAERRQLILDGAQALAHHVAIAGEAALLPDDELLDIVTNLVEKPFPVLGSFEERFLEMPKELLVSEMREHQKYFAVVDRKGALLPFFVVVAGSRSPDTEGLAAGNARVLRARFEDGAFYFKTDRERSLASRIEDLKKLVFHRELGTMWEKTARIAMLTQFLCDKLGFDAERPVKTAMLSKADLVTGVVNEFPELQGIMGRTYARHDGEHRDVSTGIEEHYAPRHAGAALPVTVEGAVVALADRIDTLVGILGIGKAPTGSADPFALRRAGIAVAHLLMDRGWRVSLEDVVTAGVAAYKAQGKLPKADTALVRQVADFVRGRVRGVLVERCEARGLAGAEDIVDAAMASRAGVDVLPDVEENAIALAELRSRDPLAFASLCKTFKRVGNILRQARTEGALELGGEEAAGATIEEALREPAETDLLRAVSAARIDTSGASLDVRRRMLESAARLKPTVDRFFDDVMVMTDDTALRSARLGLLAQIERVFVDVADFTKVQVEG